MADAFLDMHNQSAADDLSREDWLGLLIDREVTARDNKRLGRRLSLARLRQNAVVEDADLRTPRGLDRGLFQSLTTCGCNLGKTPGEYGLFACPDAGESDSSYV
jgi:hypothetical protein